MGGSQSKVCPQTEQLYKQCMRQFWSESWVASENPNVCRDEFEDWKLCYEDVIGREVAELKAQKILDEQRKALEKEAKKASALGDKVAPSNPASHNRPPSSSSPPSTEEENPS